MSEFKGTKGKWHCKGSSIMSNDIDICDLWDMGDGFPSKKESKANSLLISKAPEMLEMLKRCADAFDNIHQPFISEDIKQLIKEATEI